MLTREVFEMQKRSVLIVVTNLGMGGPQKSLIGLLQRLNSNRYDITLLVLDDRRHEMLPFVPDHVTIIRPSAELSSALWLRPRHLPSIRWLVRNLGLTSFMSALSIRRPMASIATGNRIRQAIWVRVRHKLPPVPGSYDAAIGILGMSSYVVTDLVDATLKHHWIRSDVRTLDRDRGIDTDYMRRMDGYVAVSSATASLFAEYFGVPLQKVWVYKNNIPDLGDNPSNTKVSHETQAVRLLTVTRLDRDKGLDLLADAAALLKSMGLNFRWDVLGSGPEGGRLEVELEKRGLTKHVHLAGMVMDPGPYLRGCDVFVHPSRNEGRSNAVEEAKAAGRFIIVTDYPTARSQIADGVTGRVCAIDSVDLAHTIKRSLESPQRMTSLAEAARVEYLSEEGDAQALLCWMLGESSE